MTIIPNTCIAVNAELKEAPCPITVVENSEGKIKVFCTFKAGERCLASALLDLDNTKGRIVAQPRSGEAESYPICIYTKEGMRMV